VRKNDSIEAHCRRIDYEIVFSKNRKRAEIVVRPDLKVEFRAPKGLSSAIIKEMIKEKAGWICKKLELFEANKHLYQNKQYIEGEIFLYLGKEYSLRIIALDSVKKPYTSLKDSELTVTVPLPGKTSESLIPLLVKKSVWEFYSERAKEEVGGIVANYSKKFGVDPPTFKIKYQKKRWGSCSADNILRINFQLMMAPPEQLEYVVVHELCHIKEKNHSIKFWKHVGKLMPSYEIHRRALRREGWKYVL
jgi:predicted metal-dependent hydrolase